MTMTTHDLTSGEWGNNCIIRAVRDKGMELDLAGWRSGIKNGDFLILKQRNSTTRYLVECIRYEQDPDDMWFATASFAPRDN